MVAAYEALVSLSHILDSIQLYGNHLISVDINLMKSLRERVDFLIDFLGDYSNMRGIKESIAIAPWENEMRAAAYRAEDLIEAHVVNRILPGTAQEKKELRKLDFVWKLANKFFSRSSQGDESNSTDELAQGIKELIDHMDSIKEELMKIQEESSIQTQDQQPRISGVVMGLSSRAPPVEENGLVGIEDVSIEILDRLTGQQSHRKIIPIFGMGGIGKTTLARYVYANPLAVQHFDIRSWVTISQDFNVNYVLSCILKEVGASFEANASEDTLGELLHKKLFGRRYLIVMDDIWSIDAWDKLKLFLPDNNNGSRIIMTTRLTNLVSHLDSCGFEMSFLNEDQSWSLFCKKVFGVEECPIELEKIGKNIVEKCRGLPLSISVIAGFLAKSDNAIRFWQYVAEDVNSIINSEDQEHCSRILELSYSHLPIHLKPCFLYFGFHGEDHVFVVSKLVKAWVAEGFLRPNKDKTLEKVAEDCIKDLVDRNLILVRKRGCLGNIKECSIHDLLRELCLKELQKDNFLHNIQQRPLCVNGHRRLFIPTSTLMDKDSMGQISPFRSIRSLICDYGYSIMPWKSFRLLRVWDVVHLTSPDHFREAMNRFVNSRFLSFNELRYVNDDNVFGLMHRLWNLQTLILLDSNFPSGVVVPKEIWEMQQLRHIIIKSGLTLPQPPATPMVLQNLQTLVHLNDFRSTDEIVKRIPNVNKLSFSFDQKSGKLSALCLTNLSRLSKLEYLTCDFNQLWTHVDLGRHISFPGSLKKLTLWRSKLPWEDMTVISSLPNLQVLKLNREAFVGPVWNPSEGGFRRLRFLKMRNLDLEVWAADNTHFPCLEQLSLWFMYRLIEIPSEFADMPTLRSIELLMCRDSTEVSAQRIVEERENQGDQDLLLQIY